MRKKILYGKKKKTGKINSKKTEVLGIVFDSKVEARYYLHLKQQQDIERIELQPQYILLKPFGLDCTHCKGGGKVPSPKTGKPIQCKKCKGEGVNMRQSWTYKADFRVTYKNGDVEVIDVKGHANDRFPLVKKMFEYTHKQELVVIKETDKGWKRG